jgi:hypothetical protein
MIVLCLGLGLLMAGFGLPTASTSETLAAGTSETLDRTLDPVVVMGTALPAFAGAPLTQLFVFKYSGGAWSQIPWQFDEVKGDAIVAADNGLLDGPDQLVFMAADIGDQAPSVAWITDSNSTAYPRYELAITDPLASAKQGWVYVYRSATLIPASVGDYVTYDVGQALMVSDRYRLGLFTAFPGFDRLELNGSGVDILDRTKIRLKLQFVSSVKTEQDIALTGPVTLTRAGHVRVVISGGTLIGYRALYLSILPVDLTTIPVRAEWGRFSADMSPAAAGSRYFDPNVAAGVIVDGAPDTVPAAPAADWAQVSGTTGTIVRVLNYAGAGGTPSSYYRDDQTTDPNDTGDKMSYGDAGVQIDNPARQFTFENWNYILPANQPNIGAEYREYALNPLQVQAIEQVDPNFITPTATATVTSIATATSAPTSTVTPTVTLTATNTVASTMTPTVTPTATRTPVVSTFRTWLPVVFR